MCTIALHQSDVVNGYFCIDEKLSMPVMSLEGFGKRLGLGFSKVTIECYIMTAAESPIELY